MPRRQPLDEFKLIETLLAPLAQGAPGTFGLTDDAAVVTPQDGQELVVTTDAMVRGVHYLPEDPPAEIGRKLLRVNLSDLASMGASPEAYLLTLAISPETTLSWLEEFVRGLADDQREFGVRLIGGDTVRSPTTDLFSITALGWAPSAKVISRRGARPRDEIYVSGTIGDAVLGLACAKGTVDVDDTAKRHFLTRFRRPDPRIELGTRLAGLASACLDVSDGLVADLAHLCDASGVGAVVNATAVPVSTPAAQQVTADQGLLISLITGGDDYELVFTAPAAEANAIGRLGHDLALPLTKVGRIVEGRGVHVVNDAGEEISIEQGGYAHFSAPS